MTDPKPMTELARAIAETADWSTRDRSPLTNVLQYLSGDSSCYEDADGDVTDFGFWAALFSFTPEETQELTEAGVIDALEVAEHLASLTPAPTTFDVTLVIDDAGFADARFGRDDFDTIRADYSAFLSAEDEDEDAPACPWCDRPIGADGFCVPCNEAADAEHGAAVTELQDKLDALRSDEFPCDQCNAIAINRVNCHEHGCPTDAKIRALVRQIERLEND